MWPMAVPLQLCLITFQSLTRDMYHFGTVAVYVDNLTSSRYHRLSA